MSSWVESTLQTAVLVVLALYTKATWDLRRIAQRDHELQYRPLIRLAIDKEREGFRVENIGNGHALNITVESAEFTLPKKLGVEYSFTSIDLLKPGESCTIFIDTPSKERAMFIWAHFTEFSDENHVLTATYEDIRGKKHRSVTSAGRDGTRLRAFIDNKVKTQ